VKIRYPSPVLQKAIVKYILQNASKNEKGCLQLLDYLQNYVDEVEGLVTALKSIHGTPKIQASIHAMQEKYKYYQGIWNN
jgi:hypothetical protein